MSEHCDQITVVVGPQGGMYWPRKAGTSRHLGANMVEVEYVRADLHRGVVEDAERLRAWLTLMGAVAYQAEVREYAQRALAGEAVPTDDGGQ